MFVLAEPRRWAALGAAASPGGWDAAVVGAPARASGARRRAARRRRGAHEGTRPRCSIVVVCVATAAAAEPASRSRRRLPHAAGSRCDAPVAAAIAAVLRLRAIREARALRDFTRLPVRARRPAPAGARRRPPPERQRERPLAVLDGRARRVPARAAPRRRRRHRSRPGGRGTGRSATSSGTPTRSIVETLGELGIVGFAPARRRARRGRSWSASAGWPRGRDAEAHAIAALLGAFAVVPDRRGHRLDVGADRGHGRRVGVLALLVGPATSRPRATPGCAPGGGPAAARRRRAAAVACAIVVAEAIVLLADVEVRREPGRRARAGRLAAARAHAVAATRLEPWAASALPPARARRGEYRQARSGARRTVEAAIRRDRDDWRPWFAASQIDTRLGRSAAAADDRARARSLNPRSLLLPPAG